MLVLITNHLKIIKIYHIKFSRNYNISFKWIFNFRWKRNINIKNKYLIKNFKISISNLSFINIFMLFICILLCNEKKEMILTLCYNFTIHILIWHNIHMVRIHWTLRFYFYFKGRRSTIWNRFPLTTLTFCDIIQCR